MTTKNEAPPRPAEDCMAEGVWRLIHGTHEPTETWDELPEAQKAWWRSVARSMIAEWVTAAHRGMY